jgi:plastocyanin
VSAHTRRVALLKGRRIRSVGWRRLSALAVVISAFAFGLAVAPSLAVNGPVVHIRPASNPSGYGFRPHDLDVAVGTIVHWRWQGTAPHNVTFSDGPHSPTDTEGNFRRKFTTLGTFRYVCTVHGFAGKVVVN